MEQPKMKKTRSQSFTSKTVSFDVNRTTGDVESSEDMSVDSRSTSGYSVTAKKRQRVHQKQKYQTYVAIFLILVFGCAAGAAFLSLSLLSSNDEQQTLFDQRASKLVTEIERTWQDYEYAGLWIHEACRHRNISRQEFRELYDYIRSGGLDFQAAEFIPNVTHDLRDEYEAEAEAYYGQYYPEINYRGFVGFEPVNEGSDELSIQPRSDQAFYFVVHYVEPVEPNAAAIDLDLYSSAKRRASIESALQTWKPALTDRLRLVQETDESAYSVLLMHPGIPLESSPETKPGDLSLMVIRIPSLLTRATQNQEDSLAVYLYDSTNANNKNPPQFLGGIKVIANSDGEIESSTFVEEIEMEELLQQDTPVDMFRDKVQIASSTWEAVVVPIEGTTNSGIKFELLGGILIFVGTFALSFWMYANMVRNNEMSQLQAQAEAERNIVKSLFPSKVRDRLLRDATSGDVTHSGKKNKKASDDSAVGALSSEKIFGSKPIADFFTEVTIMFADLVGFTAWSSARDPTQVFALLEVIYHSFDNLAKRREVFKLETVGDCYVAACGLPEPRDDHAEIMAKFATDCLIKLHELTSSLEITMGPDTADLDIRIGLHSGPVTAGVLRGDKGRFQLFGDTMNTANRIESTGSRSKIHVSLETAELLKASGMGHWLTLRKDAVYAKGKGLLKTYWLDINSNTNSNQGGNDSATVITTGSGTKTSKATAEGHVKSLKEQNHNKRMERLINWSVEIFSRLLKLVMAKRRAQGRAPSPKLVLHHVAATGDGGLLEEVKDIVAVPQVDQAADFERRIDVDAIELDPEVVKELHEYISVISELYHRNPFHNFEHAGHVLMSTCKLLTRIVTPRAGREEADIDREGDFATRLHEDSFGIASDPLTRFACAFSALIHDVDHPGVPNSTLVSEETTMATTYKNKSVAEQNSIDLAWDLLMSDRYSKLVKCLCDTDDELKRFRQLVVNMVMATDVMDKSIGAQRKARWELAFSEQSMHEEAETNFNRKATIVIEHLIQASDVSHTMQHWHVYRKWNERLFFEMYNAYKAGRLDFDPSEKWYQGELGFFDFYIIPMAKKLDTCGVFGVSSDELLDYASANRKEWESKGKDIVESYLDSYRDRYE